MNLQVSKRGTDATSSSTIHVTAHLNHSNPSCCSHHGNLNCSTGRCRRRRQTAGTAAGGLHDVAAASNQHASAQHPPSPPTVLAASAAVPAVLPCLSLTPPFPPPLRRWCSRRQQRRDISGRLFLTFFPSAKASGRALHLSAAARGHAAAAVTCCAAYPVPRPSCGPGCAGGRHPPVHFTQECAKRKHHACYHH